MISPVRLLSCLIAGAIASAQAGLAQQLAVVNQPERTLQLVDGRSGSILLTAKMGERPHEVALSSDGRLAYVPVYGDGAVGRPGTDGELVEIVDLATGRGGRMAVGKVRPHDARIGRDGLLYVTAEVDRAVLAVDPASGAVIARIPTGAAESHSLALSPDGRRAYTANVASGSISVLDLKRRRLIGVVPVAAMVQRVTVSPDGARVFTHDQRAPRLVAVDPVGLRIARTYTLPGLPYASAITPDGRTALVAGRPTLPGTPATTPALYVVDLRSGAVGTIATPGWPRVIEIENARTAWLNFGSGEIARFDLETRALTIVARLERGLDGMALRRSK
jgi:DNA-binding beta-propeller fold protein YncE